MILITGAAGLFGLTIIKALKRKGARVRGLAHGDKEAEMIRRAGAEEAVLGDLRDPGSLERALTGVQSVYHICPRLQKDELEIGKNMIAAARKTGVEFFVYHSVIHPPIPDIAFHWEKMKVEVELITSGLTFAIIQPTNLMQNVLWTWERIVTEGIYLLPYSADSRLSWVDVHDVGEVVARVLTEPGHEGATYELAGPEGPITRHELCAIIAHVLGRPVRAETQPVDTYIARTVRFSSRSPDELAMIRTMFAFYDRYGLPCGNPHILEMLLGRRSTDYETCLRRILSEIS